MSSDLFKNLHDSEIGKNLVEYLREELKTMCDIRNIKDDPKVVELAANFIEDKLIRKITMQNETREPQKNPFT